MKNATAIDLVHLDASLQAIGINVAAHYAGQSHAYRTVATELRKLIVDRNRGKDTSLLPRCLPGIQLHPLRGRPDMIDEHTSFYLAALIQFDGQGGSDIVELFDEHAQLMPIDAWLGQLIFNKNITLGEFIRSVADREGAHADAEANHTLEITKSVFLGRIDSAAQHIIAIARYLARGVAIRAIASNAAMQTWMMGQLGGSERGVFFLQLSEMCRSGLNEMPLRYVRLEEITSDLAIEHRDAFRRQVDASDPRSEFILYLVDLNGKRRTSLSMRFATTV